MYGIVNLSAVPVRSEASDKSEMVTQLLFGEHFSILSKSKSWRKIKNAFDGYEGWIDEKQFTEIGEEEFQKLNAEPAHLSLDMVQIAVHKGQISALLLGSSLPFYDGKLLRVGNEEYTFTGHCKNLNIPVKKESLAENAFLYLNAPYLWGGRSPFGIDCSGLTQMIYKLNGIKLPRDASEQAKEGETIDFQEEAEPGDLAFFDNEEGKIIHVGMILAESKIIHASGRVRVDRIDHYGIHNTEMKKYSHKLRVIKRYV